MNSFHKAKQQRLSDTFDDESTDFDYDIDSDDVIWEQGLTRLSSLVRSQYLSFLKKLLNENCKKWLNEQEYDDDSISLEDIEKCALLLEKRAVKACMIVELYRRHMLRIITEIRRETKHGKLVSNLQSFDRLGTKAKEKYQDDEYNDYKSIKLKEMRFECFTLQEKIQQFQSILNEKEKKKRDEKENRKNSYRLFLKRKHSPVQNRNYSYNQSPLTPSSTASNTEEDNGKKSDNGQDNIEQELEQLFGETNDPIEEIFGDRSESTTKIDFILREIEQAELPCENSNQNLKVDNASTIEGKNWYIENELRESLWPCECYMRRRKLRDVLNQVAETGIRQHEMIRSKFIQLFGEDSDDEFAPYSPSLEIDDILISSCMKRIAPWIVKCLMKPLKDGLIGSRYLFKKLAKKLAYNIILQEMYPDEEFVTTAVEKFFRYKLYIGSIDDIEMC